jgi:hypothetical protein
MTKIISCQPLILLLCIYNDLLLHHILYCSLFYLSCQDFFSQITLNITTKTITESAVGEFFKLVAELGFPIAAAMAAGYFVFLTLKFILAGVTSGVKGMSGIIQALDKRVATMNHDVIRIDTLVSNALGVKPDVDRIARSEQSDARRD